MKREPTREEGRRALEAILRGLPEFGQLIDKKIEFGQLSASSAGRKALQEARVAVAQLVERIAAEFRLLGALDDAESSAPAPVVDREPGWRDRN